MSSWTNTRRLWLYRIATLLITAVLAHLLTVWAVPRLIMQVLQRDVAVRGNGKPTGNESFLLAIDPATGKDLWRHVRPSEAVAESREAFSTPLPFVHNGRAELVVVGGDGRRGANGAHDGAPGLATR